MATYPGGAILFPARVDGVSVYAQHPNLIQDEVAAIENGLLNGFAHGVNLQKAVRLAGEVTPAQIIADANDYAPTGLDVATTLRLSTDASRNITGLLAQPPGTVLLVQNVGANPAVLVHESASSVAANRLVCPSAANITLAGNNSAILVYDQTAGRWRVTASTSVPVTLPSVWTAYTPAWTVTGGAVPSIGNGTLRGRYMRMGKTVFYQIELIGGSTTVWGTAGQAWRFGLPGAAMAGAYNGNWIAGYVWCWKSGANHYTDLVYCPSTTFVQMFAQHGAVGVHGPTVPFTWAANDQLHAQGFYEEA